MGNPSINVWGVRGEGSPYDKEALDGDTLFVDVVEGDISLYPVLPPGNMGDFQQEQEAFHAHWKGLKELERHDSTAPIIDEVLATAHILSGTKDANKAAYDVVRTVPLTEFGSQGNDPNAIVFERFAQAIRLAYGEGRDNEAFALASLIPRVAMLNDRFWKAPEQQEGAPQTVKLLLGNDVWKLFENYRGQEARTLQLRALERILDQGQEGATPLTDLEQKRLRIVRAGLISGYSITRLTAEVTLDDIKTYPSTANPRPDLGVPEYGGTRWLMGGSESGNTSIIYPNGQVYLGDMPIHGVTRAITPEIAEAEKLHGSYVDGHFVRTGANGVVNPGTSNNEEFGGRISISDEFKSAYGRVVDSLAQVDHEKLYADHFELLTKLCERFGYAPVGLLEANSTDSHNSLITGQQLFGAYIEALAEMAQDDPGAALSLFEYAFAGWQSRGDAESAVGLEHSDAPYDYLMMEWNNHLWNAFFDYKSPDVRSYFDGLRDKVRDLGQVFQYQKMVGLAESMAKHTQVAEYVASLQAPEVTLDEAVQAILTHHSNFNSAWLQYS